MCKQTRAKNAKMDADTCVCTAHTRVVGKGVHYSKDWSYQDYHSQVIFTTSCRIF